MNKSNTGKWKDEDSKTTWQKLNSAKVYAQDTSLHSFQHNLFTPGWGRDMGNLGSPVNQLMFAPENRVGPSLGYHINDAYRLNVDSMNFYQTLRPYSVFNYQLGSKLEQTVGIIHTQNIQPNWNFAVDYRKVNSSGFYQTQRNNHDIAGFTTNYKSLDKHYELYAAMAYNKIQHDENGGILSTTQLDDPAFQDRKTVNTAYENGAYSLTRSPVTNVQRDFTLLLQHSYRWGRSDTTYNQDSTQFTYKLIPRFSITHKLELSTEKHTYKDLKPDSLRYLSLFNYSFPNTGTNYYAAGLDSVFTQQKWFWVDNRLLLNGFIGHEGKQMEFSAGLGTRYDQFISVPTANLIHDSLPKLYYSTGLDRSSIISTYLVASVVKEALTSRAWDYGLNTQFFLAGQDAGNFVANAHIGKNLGNNLGRFLAGVQQQVNSAPYSYTNYENMYTKSFFTFSNESITQLYATIEYPLYHISAGAKNYLIANYIYINDSERPASYTVPFSITQLWLRKVFRLGDFYLGNELVYQQLPDNAPVNVPTLMGRHQLTFEKAAFHRRLKIATGLEMRYNTAYHPAGYDALLNRFYNQTTSYVSNNPELTVFFNFRIKRLRAYVMGDNLQQLFAGNTLLYTGTPVYNYNKTGLSYTPVYATPDALIRFGFTWIMVN